MNIRFYQKALFEWQQKNFGIEPPEWMMSGVTEEVGEFAHALLKHHQKIRGYESEEFFKSQIKDAYGDINVYLMQILSFYGIDAEEALKECFEHVLNRDWKSNKLNGGSDIEPIKINAPQEANSSTDQLELDFSSNNSNVFDNLDDTELD
jgi:NTP pyrophosphatase (non-canonical NTP hydrolase)